MNERTNERMDGWMNEWTDRRIDWTDQLWWRGLIGWLRWCDSERSTEYLSSSDWRPTVEFHSKRTERPPCELIHTKTSIHTCTWAYVGVLPRSGYVTAHANVGLCMHEYTHTIHTYIHEHSYIHAYKIYMHTCIIAHACMYTWKYRMAMIPWISHTKTIHFSRARVRSCHWVVFFQGALHKCATLVNEWMNAMLLLIRNEHAILFVTDVGEVVAVVVVVVAIVEVFLP